MTLDDLYTVNERLNAQIYEKVFSQVSSADEIPAAFEALSDNEKFILCSFVSMMVPENYEGQLEAEAVQNLIEVYES